METKPKKILAIASGGGHWVQLRRLMPAFEGHDVVFATVNPAYRSDVADYKFYTVTDATRWDRLKLVRLVLELVWLLLRQRPDVVISTGAAPGYIALRLAKWMRIRTVWIDSIANVERLSLSGEWAGGFADLWLTQWAHLGQPDGPAYRGSVL